MERSQRKLKEGVSDALIAHFDATSMELLPEEVATVDEAIFDDLLASSDITAGCTGRPGYERLVN